jgi:hypothetical protein
MSIEKPEKRKDFFILEFSKIAKDLKKNIGNILVEKKFNFKSELDKLKENVQTNYSYFSGNKMMDKVRELISETDKHYSSLLVEKLKIPQIGYDQSLITSVMKKYMSYRKSSVKKEKIIDLDILFRDLAKEINCFRLNPTEFYNKNKDEEFFDIGKNEPIFKSLVGKTFNKIEWDCDLAEAADKFLLKYPIPSQENFLHLKENMKEIMKEIFNYEVFDCNYLMIPPNKNNSIFDVINNFQAFSNVLCGNFNLIGISGIPFNNRILIIINLAEFRI